MFTIDLCIITYLSWGGRGKFQTDKTRIYSQILKRECGDTTIVQSHHLQYIHTLILEIRTSNTVKKETHIC